MIKDENVHIIGEKKEESRWESYETYRTRKLFLAAKEWFMWKYGMSYQPTQEEMDKLMTNPDFIKDHL